MRHSVNICCTILFLSGVIAAPAAAGDSIHVSRQEAVKAATTRVEPEYSTVARQLKLEGEVKVDVVINEEGAVDEITPISGNPVLAQCVKEALKRWKFTPFKVDGKSVKATAPFSFTFKMN
ncbi:MAG TPA: energy transducer TonB [Bryobacteraceae bacterium]|nr:energy transducer TonB [Bryobacteraceae bacterium]